MIKRVVYTAIFGGYDEIKEPAPQNVPCDFVCFTDNPSIRRPSSSWRVIEARQEAVHPRMQAKWFKLMNHRVFPNGWLDRVRYDVTIWIDGSILIKSTAFVRELCGYIGPNGWALLPHPDRDCIYDECVVSAEMAKYNSQSMAEQVAHYRLLGHPPHGGLWACGVIARKSDDSRLIVLNVLWWDENLRWSYQDQLSLPFLLRRLRLGVDRVPRDLWRNEWFDCLSHNSEA